MRYYVTLVRMTIIKTLETIYSREGAEKGEPFILLVCVCLVAQSCLTLCDLMDCSLPGSSVHGNSPGKKTGVVFHAFLSGDLPNPGTKPRSPILQMDSLPSEPPGKLMNSQVGSQSLLQGIFPTQELNSDLLHCRHILYQLSYQGSPEQVWRNTNLSDTTKITPMNSITYSAIIFFFYFFIL